MSTRSCGSKMPKRALTHAFTTKDVGEPAKEELAEEVTDRSCDLNAEILVGV
jgi:hypothetical protein